MSHASLSQPLGSALMSAKSPSDGRLALAQAIIVARMQKAERGNGRLAEYNSVRVAYKMVIE